MDGFMPGTECVACKGRCCKDKGCSLSPEDLLEALEGKEATRTNILELLQKEDGLYTIDYFSEADGPVFYLRMRHKCYNFIGVDAMGECVALTDQGCLLDERRRPKGGRYLESRPGMHCEQRYTREMMIADWMGLRETLASIWNEFYPKMLEDGTFDRCDEAYFEWQKKQREKSFFSD